MLWYMHLFFFCCINVILPHTVRRLRSTTMPKKWKEQKEHGAGGVYITATSLVQVQRGPLSHVNSLSLNHKGLMKTPEGTCGSEETNSFIKNINVILMGSSSEMPSCISYSCSIDYIILSCPH